MNPYILPLVVTQSLTIDMQKERRDQTHYYMTWTKINIEFINDLTNACNSDIILYADDSVLLCVEQSIEKLKIKIEASFRKIECWINCNRLTINYKKQTVFCSHVKT